MGRSEGQQYLVVAFKAPKVQIRKEAVGNLFFDSLNGILQNFGSSEV